MSSSSGFEVALMDYLSGFILVSVPLTSSRLARSNNAYPNISRPCDLICDLRRTRFASATSLSLASKPIVKPTLFVAAAGLIIDRQSQRSQEYRRGLIEGDVMLA